MFVLSCLFPQLRYCMGSLQQLATDSTSMKYSKCKMNCKNISNSKFAADTGYLCGEHLVTVAVQGCGQS